MITSFRTAIKANDTGKMWQFAKANCVNILFNRHMSSNEIYVYEILAEPETYTAFLLAVPVTKA